MGYAFLLIACVVLLSGAVVLACVLGGAILVGSVIHVGNEIDEQPMDGRL